MGLLVYNGPSFNKYRRMKMKSLYSEELRDYDNLQLIHEVLGKQRIRTLEGKTMTLAEWRLKNSEPKKFKRGGA